MRMSCCVVPLVLLAVGCAASSAGQSAPESKRVATSQNASGPVVRPAPPAAPKAAPAATAAPPANTPLPKAAGDTASPVTKPRPATPPLDLNTLEEQLKDTKAIGFFTKLTLKNQVDDLLDKFRDHYRGKGHLTMTDLRRSYELLILKVLSLLQDEDQKLAAAIASSREAIWNLLADPKSFATIQG